MKKILIVLLALSALGIGVFGSNLPKRNISSPLAPSGNTPPKRIIGFLPYWQLNTLNQSRLAVLTDVFFFGVHFDEKGALDTKDLARLDDAPFVAVQKNSHVTLALILQDNEKIEFFLEDKKAWDSFLDNVSPLITAHALQGINIDMEYSGIPARATIDGFTDFVTYVTKRLKEKDPTIIVSVDMTADAVRKSRLYDVEHIASQVDYIVLMGYDFFKPGSSVAGPVAPLFGHEIYEHDVSSAVADFLTVVPPEKLVLGVAYYGWDFPTATNERGSFVEERPDESVALATYRRTRKLLEEGKVVEHFDEDSQTPWMTYKDETTGGIRQIWYEDAISLGKKYDFINDKKLAGVAIWALGYDGDYPDLANLLIQKFK